MNIPCFMILLLIACLSCRKGQHTVKPQLQISSYSTKVLAKQKELVITVKIIDEKGDIGKGRFVYIPVRTNQRPVSISPDLHPVSIDMSNFSDHAVVDYELRLTWNSLKRSQVENDSMYFRFIVFDRAGNKSDTVNSDRLVILEK